MLEQKRAANARCMAVFPYVYPPTNNSSANWKSLVEEFPDIVSVNDLIDNYYTEFIAKR